MATPYIPNLIEQLKLNTQRKVALAAPDGMPFMDVSGDMVTRKRTELVTRPGRKAIYAGSYPPAPAKPTQAEVLGMLA